MKEPKKITTRKTWRKKVTVSLFLALIQGCSIKNDGPFTARTWDWQPDEQSATSKSPIPYAEFALPNRVASSFATATRSDTVLEGASFDRAGGLVFSDVKGRRLLRMDSRGQVDTLASFARGNPGGTAIHRDGRIYVALITDQYTSGSIVAVSPDGREQHIIIGPEQGFVPNDLVFDVAGGFYFTNFRGNSTSPAGGVYYVSPDGSAVTPVLLHLSLANGVALSPNGRTLWVTEYGRNLLHTIKLDTATTIAPLGTSVPYRFTGAGPDSMRIDSEGNVYVAMMEQGRVMVFAPNGVPVSQVLLPQRDAGLNLESASLALSPDSKRLYIVAGGGGSGLGTSIFESEGLARGLKLYSHN